MLKKATNGLWVLIGLALGVVLAYYGFKTIFVQGLKLMRHDAQESFSIAEIRLQRMADAALEMEKRMVDLGWKGPKDTFSRAEKLRSLLAGHEELPKKAVWAVDLEHELLDAQEIWEKEGARDPKIGKNFYFQEHVRWWANELRWLAREEAETRLAFEHYNQTIHKFPFNLFAKNYAPQVVAKGMLNAAQNKPALEEGETASPSTPTAEVKPLVEPLPDLTFEDKAAWPEEYYAEVQYRPMPSQLTVEEGEGEPLLERDQDKKAFEAISAFRKKKDVIGKDEYFNKKDKK